MQPHCAAIGPSQFLQCDVARQDCFVCTNLQTALQSKIWCSLRRTCSPWLCGYCATHILIDTYGSLYWCLCLFVYILLYWFGLIRQLVSSTLALWWIHSLCDLSCVYLSTLVCSCISNRYLPIARPLAILHIYSSTDTVSVFVVFTHIKQYWMTWILQVYLA